VRPLTALEQRIAARTSASVTKTFLFRLFNSSAEYQLNISKCDETRENNSLWVYRDNQFIPLCICATSYFDYQLHGDLALSMKQRLCKRRPEVLWEKEFAAC
jgi:hypothetical protein